MTTYSQTPEGVVITRASEPPGLTKKQRALLHTLANALTLIAGALNVAAKALVEYAAN